MRASLDLTSLASSYASGTTLSDVLADVLARIVAYADPAVWIHRCSDADLLAQVEAVEQQRRAGQFLPLYGVPFAVKDNIDVAGHPTTAACPAFTYVAERTAPVVERLMRAGAILLGKTNLDQFATGLVGDRSPYGACRNVFSPEHISGGSSSGSAVAVAAGLVSFALGTDTAGSGRVPAGCNNIVGLKPTPGTLETEGVVPACRSLDCVSVFALTADDALRVYETARGARAPHARTGTGVGDVVFAVPRSADLEFFGDEGQHDGFISAVAGMEGMGWHPREIDLTPFRRVAALLYEGPWVAERYAALRPFLATHGDQMHPVTRGIVEGGARYGAADLFEAGYELESLRAACLRVFDACDVLVVPTIPSLPTLSAVHADSAGWGRKMGYYTNFVNLLRFAAVAVPAGFTASGLPVGVTLIGPPGSERRLCELADAWGRRANLPLGASGHRLPVGSAGASGGPPPGFVRLAVAGAHLRGQPLHSELRRAGAVFVRSCRTASHYRFVALMDLSPPRPGLVRHDGGASIAVEIYDLPLAGFGAVVAAVARPLAIGTIDLEDGEAIKGYLCEGFAAARARDITEFGGWVAFRDHLQRASS